MKNKKELGEKRLNEVMGKNSAEQLKSFDEISPIFAHYVREHVWGDVYTRDKLNDKVRLAAVLGALLGQGNTGVPIRRYIRAMLNTGWEKEEILELITFLTVYAGYPIAVDAIYIAQEVFSERYAPPKV